MTTTETESIEALHLWLAEKLRLWRPEEPGYYGKQPMVPNVTTDAIDGALMDLGYHVSRAKVNDEYRTLYSWPDDSSWSQMAYGTTAHESACLAAKLVLQ